MRLYTVKRDRQMIVYLMWNVNWRADRSGNIRFDKSIFAQFYHIETACILIKRSIRWGYETFRRFVISLVTQHMVCWTNYFYFDLSLFCRMLVYYSTIRVQRRKKRNFKTLISAKPECMKFLRKDSYVNYTVSILR